jgi:hypothetical protein
MIVCFQGHGPSFSIPVVATSRIKDIRAIARYYLRVSCGLSLLYRGRYLRDGLEVPHELRHYDVQDKSTLIVELHFLSTSVPDEAHDAFYCSLCQQACCAFD